MPADQLVLRTQWPVTRSVTVPAATSLSTLLSSLGGMMNGSTTKVYASWKRVMTRRPYYLCSNG
jgi:hypothetical protein